MLNSSGIVPNFIVDSEFRTNREDNSSNFNYQFTIPKEQDYTHAAIISAYIPKTFSTIGLSNQEITLVEDGVPNTGYFTLGSYNVVSFAIEYGNVLTNISTHGWTYVVTYPDPINEPNTYKFTVRVIGNTGLLPIYIDLQGDRLNDLLGFRDRTASATFINGTYLYSEIAYNLQHTRYITILSDMVDNEGNADSKDSGVFVRIDCAHFQQNDIIEYTSNELNDNIRKIKKNKSNTYNFQIQDDHGRPLDLEGFNYSFQMIMFKIDYPTPTFTETILDNNPVPVPVPVTKAFVPLAPYVKQTVPPFNPKGLPKTKGNE